MYETGMMHTRVLAVRVIEEDLCALMIVSTSRLSTTLHAVRVDRVRTRRDAFWPRRGGAKRGLALSPTAISFIRFRASKLRTPSHGVVPHASKSSTLNCRGLGMRRGACGTGTCAGAP